jgi:2-polyprenyl-3-methyl-5-hydroxy-6-metoxy-1,4-benzoquinol methylase
LLLHRPEPDDDDDEGEGLTLRCVRVGQALPEGTEQFDLVWSFGVIHHTPHPERVIRQIRRLLKPGGELRYVVITITTTSMHPLSFTQPARRIMLYSKVSFKLFFLMKETGEWDFSKLDQLIARYSEAQTGSLSLSLPEEDDD